jgi:hypothetical protein
MWKPGTIRDEAMIDALLDRADPTALERLRRQAQRDPEAAARLSEWTQVLGAPASQLQLARQASRRVARRVGERLAGGPSAEALTRGERIGRPRWRMAPWKLAAAACCAMAVVGGLAWLSGHRPAFEDSRPLTLWQSPAVAVAVPGAGTREGTAGAETADGSLLPVRDPIETIRQSRAGATLVVGPGRIHGPLRIDKPLTLVGAVQQDRVNKL